MEIPAEPYNHLRVELEILERYGNYDDAANAMWGSLGQGGPDLLSQDPLNDYCELELTSDSRNIKRPLAVPWDLYETWLMSKWTELIDSDPDEPDVQAFLERHPSLLPAAADDVGRGHHGACWDAVITQPRLKGLGRDRIPDFMWVRRDTSTVHIICIEIEAPRKQWFTESGWATAELNQALDQILDWKLWFSNPENMLSFRHAYIPAELGYRRIEVQYILVYGRDAEFRIGRSRHKRPDVLRAKRDLIPRASEFLYTFDQLRPAKDAKYVSSISGMRGDFSMRGVPPTIGTGEATKTLAAEISNIESAISMTPLISDRRRAYLIQRWQYWRDEALRSENGMAPGVLWESGYFDE
ncbi:Shedu anti-phage system protein SduA domain-containing protein [Streptosporangium sp. NPDC000563]|uniref:Shedu anti-phage system protein SduA domain-containing protein n=1 Tax=Streptosporangium sp. NPDC000563 TaxID=3154366 RepID=UPI003328EEF9